MYVKLHYLYFYARVALEPFYDRKLLHFR